jgi:hypothetical protein
MVIVALSGAQASTSESGETDTIRMIRRYVLQKLGLYPTFLLYRGWLTENGWVRTSLERQPMTREGRPLPWMTYPAIGFLEGRLSKSMEVFEFGAGNSTLWWAERVGRIDACEHDPGWYEATRARLASNASLIHHPLEPDGDYCRAAEATRSEYDLVVIDGRDRVNCARHSLAALKPAGVFVWDNSDRPEFEEGLRIVKPLGFRTLDFEGLGPVNPYPWRTSILYRDGNCLGI